MYCAVWPLCAFPLRVHICHKLSSVLIIVSSFIFPHFFQIKKTFKKTLNISLTLNFVLLLYSLQFCGLFLVFLLLSVAPPLLITHLVTSLSLSLCVSLSLSLCFAAVLAGVCTPFHYGWLLKLIKEGHSSSQWLTHCTTTLLTHALKGAQNKQKGSLMVQREGGTVMLNLMQHLCADQTHYVK